jgi:DNA-binding NarL/FixJ family response regulator
MAHTYRPQLIISDIVMPSMDGFAFVRALRADLVLQATRVIFCTAVYHEREAARLAQACHVARVLVKPCEPADVLAAVKQALAGVAATDHSMLTNDFDRKHLSLIGNKLSEKSNALEAANARLMALLDLNILLTSDKDPHLLLERVCAGARRLIGCRYAVLAVSDDEGTHTRFFASSGIDFSDLAPPPPVLHSGPLGSVVAHRRAWRAQATQGNPVGCGLPPGYPPALAVLAVPLVTKMRALGWLCLADKVGADCFDAEDERFLCGLGSMAGRLYEVCTLQSERLEDLELLQDQDDRFRELIDDQEMYLNRVHAVTGGLMKLAVQAQTRQALFDDVCRLLIAQGGLGLAFIQARDSRSGELRTLAAAGTDASLPQPPSREAGSLKFLVASVMDSMHPVICNELQNASEYLAFHQAMFKKGFRALAVIPFPSGNAAIGCLVVATRRPQSFTAAETRLLSSVVEAVSLSLGRISREVHPA